MKYRKKPVEIEAVQFDGTDTRGVCRCRLFGAKGAERELTDRGPHLHTIHNNQPVLLEVGDWIIPEPDGEHFYPCKPDIFAATYELVVEEEMSETEQELRALLLMLGHHAGGCRTGEGMDAEAEAAYVEKIVAFHTAQVRQAVDAERERCAKVADEQGEAWQREATKFGRSGSLIEEGVANAKMAALERVRTWPIADGIGTWFDYIQSIGHWWPDQSFGWHVEDKGPNAAGDPIHLVSISTGGWSGNEDILGAMQDNAIMWTLTWETSRRGGHFEFRFCRPVVATLPPVAAR